MRLHHWRERKTGPEHPLMVVRCEVHEVALTVYPPGHYPYGRRALAPCSPGGVEPAASERDWKNTIFEAATSGANGRAWMREAAWGSEWWWSSQGRLLDLALMLTGTHPELAEGLRHRIAEALQVPVLELREQASGIRAHPGYRRRGVAVVAVLGKLTGSVVRRLLVVGQLVGLWGRALWWNGVLQPLSAFPHSGTDPPDGEPTGRNGLRK